MPTPAAHDPEMDRATMEVTRALVNLFNTPAWRRLKLTLQGLEPEGRKEKLFLIIRNGMSKNLTTFRMKPE